jgi:glycosyltransferase involved in cell wall biosynthesis
LVRGLGIETRVCFFGRADATEVLLLLNGCLFLTIPSRCEPFGIVALEALAAGKPVLATRVGGMADFLSGIRDRFFRPSGDAAVPGRLKITPVGLVEPTVEGLAEGLRVQFESGPDDAGRVREVLRDDFSWARVAERYERVLAGCQERSDEKTKTP